MGRSFTSLQFIEGEMDAVEVGITEDYVIIDVFLG